MTGDFVEAGRAAELGLVNRVAPAARLADEAEALARQIAAKLATTVRIGKRAFYDQLDLPVADAYALTRAAMVENLLTTETEEGMAAFIDKRPPDWRE